MHINSRLSVQSDPPEEREWLRPSRLSAAHPFGEGRAAVCGTNLASFLTEFRAEILIGSAAGALISVSLKYICAALLILWLAAGGQ